VHPVPSGWHTLAGGPDGVGEDEVTDTGGDTLGVGEDEATDAGGEDDVTDTGGEDEVTDTVGDGKDADNGEDEDDKDVDGWSEICCTAATGWFEAVAVGGGEPVAARAAPAPPLRSRRRPRLPP
jgi:hypothetical protein